MSKNPNSTFRVLAMPSVLFRPRHLELDKLAMEETLPSKETKFTVMQL